MLMLLLLQVVPQVQVTGGMTEAQGGALVIMVGMILGGFLLTSMWINAIMNEVREIGRFLRARR